MLRLLILPLALACPIYKDPRRPVSECVADLLSQMKLEEKVGQLALINSQENLTRESKRHQAGAVKQIYGADTQPVYDLVAWTRLQILVLFGLDAIHGNGLFPGATVYPTVLTIAAAWNPDIIEEIGAATAEELHHTGIHSACSPVFCITHEPRWVASARRPVTTRS
jgi:beta-glucosidase